MKNKRLLAVLAALAVLLVGYLGYTSLNSNSTDKPDGDEQVTVGVLQFVSHESLDEIYQGIKAGLKDAGYSDGDKIKINFMNAEGNQSQIQTMSKRLADDSDIMIGIATPAAQGLANASKEIPIIMGAVTDPLGANLVQSLDKPGANVTGVSDATPVADTVDLIKEITPDVKTIGALYSSSEDNSLSQVEAFTKAAEQAGLTVKPYAVPSTNEITATTNSMLTEVDAVWTPTDNTIASAFPTVAKLAEQAEIPVFTSVQAMLEQGGLASVSLSQYDLGVATGKMAAKVIEGADPATTAVDVYDKGSIILNQTVANKLGISFSDKVKESADTIYQD